MRFDPDQLETLIVIAEEGSFEAAARRLHVTPSAVSQRVRAIEGAAGQVLIRRTSPAAVTTAGEPLIRLARKLRTLVAEAGTELGRDDVVELSVAVNADSLGTWFRPVLANVADRPNVALRLRIEDEGHSHELLRRGEVLAAVTAEPTPIQGCSVEPLGAMRYRAAATRTLLDRHRRGRGVNWATVPMVVFNEKDRLQDDLLAARRTDRPPIVHRVPSTADFFEAVRAGLGWGLVPLPQLAPALASGELVPMPGSASVTVALFWQRWRLESQTLEVLSAAVRKAARESLRHP